MVTRREPRQEPPEPASLSGSPEGERWFELACVLWIGAIVPPFGAVLSAIATFERIRRGQLPRWSRLLCVIVAIVPTTWLVVWGWREATRPRVAEDRPARISLGDLDLIERVVVVGTGVHAVLGALAGALWGARTANQDTALFRSGIGALAGSGWAWCVAGAYFLTGWSTIPVPRGAGALFFVFPLAALAYCHRVEKRARQVPAWSRVAD